MFLHRAKRELEMLVGLYRISITEFNQAIAECDREDEDPYMFIVDRDSLQEMLKNILTDLNTVKCMLNN